MIETILKNLRWLGHDGFFLRAQGKNIYFDPYTLTGDLSLADLVLITHDHYDHCSPEDLAQISHPGTCFVTEKKSAKKLSGNISVMLPGEQLLISGIEVETVPAYNINKKFHPRKNNGLGFIITVDGVRVYHAGDTDFVPEMKDIRADIALLPVSGTYVMTAQEAVAAALAIQPRVAIPMHYGSLVGTNEDAHVFAEALAGKVRVEIL